MNRDGTASSRQLASSCTVCSARAADEMGAAIASSAVVSAASRSAGGGGVVSDWEGIAAPSIDNRARACCGWPAPNL